jgi:hypothetical protein
MGGKAEHGSDQRRESRVHTSLIGGETESRGQSGSTRYTQKNRSLAVRAAKHPVNEEF